MHPGYTESGSCRPRLLDRFGSDRIEAVLGRSLVGDRDEDRGGGRCRYCAGCRAPITDDGQCITVGGSHGHVFRNPHDMVFYVGCFAAARGCAHMGDWTGRWSWFPGYRWQIALCSRCGTHLGWCYRDSDGGGFYGLILSRLTRNGGD